MVMRKSENQNELLRVLADHEKRICVLEKKQPTKTNREKSWFRYGSTIEKIVNLIGEGFFNTPHSISDIIAKLKTKDFHLEAPDLTLPLRKVVRKGLLERTKKKSDGSFSKTWLYVKI
jgi:hypothetical protein